MPRARQPQSLKARAVRWLSQREHSEAELRRKLMRVEREVVRRAALMDDRAAVGVAAALRADGRRPVPAADRGSNRADSARTSGATGDDAGMDTADGFGHSELSGRVDVVIAWLREHDFLSDARFIESRVHARAPGHGLRRIRHELEQHGVSLPADATAVLRSTELDRADAMRRRRFGDDGPATASEQARCARWLVQRGFSGDTVARVVRAMRQSSAGPRDQAAMQIETDVVTETADDM